MRAPLDDEALGLLVSRTLEDTAYAFASPTFDPYTPVADDIAVSLSFQGPEDGHVLVHGARALGNALAAALLGIEPSDDDAAAGASDAIGEVTNILAGAIIHHLYGSHVLCRLGTPQILAMEPAAPRPLATAQLLVDDEHPLFVAVYAR